MTEGFFFIFFIFYFFLFIGVSKVFPFIFCCNQVGQYSNGTHCVDCPAGFMCPSPLGTPQECPAGSYQDNEGQAVCKLCPAGQSCLMVSDSPVNCEDGYYSLVGQQVCSVSYVKYIKTR